MFHVALVWSQSALSRLPRGAEPPRPTITPTSIHSANRTRARSPPPPSRLHPPLAHTTSSGNTNLLHTRRTQQFIYDNMLSVAEMLPPWLLNLFCRMPSEGSRKVGEPRLVTVRRPGVEVGVMLCGGNLRGVYIESLDEDSPARGPDGLLPGDLILEVWYKTHTVCCWFFSWCIQGESQCITWMFKILLMHQPDCSFCASPVY